MRQIPLLLLLALLAPPQLASAGLMDTARYAACTAEWSLRTTWQQYFSPQDGNTAVTPESLGNPWAQIYPGGEQIYARNPWDLQAYNNKLYLGGGNSSNKGPAQNAGPVPILALDPATGMVIREGQVDEEQIDRFTAHDEHLYIPGHDPTQSWKLGNFYQRQEDGVWRKFRTIPQALHTYDMAWQGGTMFAGLGTKKGAAVAASTDNGETWQVQQLGRNRVYTFLSLDATLYAAKGIPSRGQTRKAREEDGEELFGIAELQPDGTFAPRPDLSEAVLFPQGLGLEERAKKIVRPLVVADSLLYIGAYVHNDHQSLPFGLFLARSLKEGRAEVQRICLPSQYRPWDILAHGDFVYLLAEQTTGGGRQPLVRVLRAGKENLAAWEEVLRFAAPAFARSFEVIGNDFYFGLGSEISDAVHWRQAELKPETGTLLRVRNLAK